MLEIFYPERNGIRPHLILDIDYYISLMNNKVSTSGIYPKINRGKYYFQFTHKLFGVMLVHRFVMNPFSSKMIDHKNGESGDNRKQNLRYSTPSRNQMNRLKKRKSNLGYMHIQKRFNLFRVRIGTKYCKSGFKTLEEAIEHHKEILPKLYPKEYLTIFKHNGYV